MQKIEILRKILRILRKIAKKVHAACFLGFYVKSKFLSSLVPSIVPNTWVGDFFKFRQRFSHRALRGLRRSFNKQPREAMVW